MNCQQVDKYILNYCNDNLSPELAIKLEEHLKGCSICTQGLELTKAENTLLGNLPVVEPSSDFTLKVMQNIDAYNNSKKTENNHRKYLLWFLPVAAVLILFLTTSFPSIFNLFNPVKLSQSEDSSPQVAMESEPVKIFLNDTFEDVLINDTDQGEAIISQELGTSPSEEGNKIKSMITDDIDQAPEYERNIMNLDSPNRAEPLLRMANIGISNVNISPQNIPLGFSLLNVTHDNDNQVTYCYLDEDREIIFDIIITNLNMRTDDIYGNYTKEKDGNINLPAANEYKQNTTLNIISFELDNDDEHYEISIISNLTPDEIITFSETINFIN